MKKSINTLFFSFLLVLGLLFIMPAQEAEAATFTQTGRTKTSVSFSWEAPENYEVTNYYVHQQKYTKDGYVWKLIQTLPGDQTSTTVKGLKAGTAYNFQITYDFYGVSGTFYEDSYIGTAYDIFTSLGKVQNVKQDRWWYFILKFDVAWDEQSAADGYQYRVYNSSGKLKKKGLVEGNYEYVGIDNIVNTQVYNIQVRSYKDIDGKRVYGAWSNKCYCFTQPRITKATVAKNKLTVKWNKVNGATGYDVYVSTKADKGYKKVKTVGKDTKSITIKKFNGNKIKNNKKYYVYVVTRKKVGDTVHKSGRLYYWNTKDTSTGYF